MIDQNNVSIWHIWIEVENTVDSVISFTEFVQDFMDDPIGTIATHIYNPNTKQWAFINSDGTFNTAFKLSDTQYKYLIETGDVR
ncbi:MAG: hypothetical protein HFJ57_07935 [Clostridia bacterium]|nr:hypothetical protein [Clostridia bacterium]